MRAGVWKNLIFFRAVISLLKISRSKDLLGMISQLSLFDTADVIKPTYEVGDRVKLRKKPMAASYLKKGDVVEVAAIHPRDGSIKFWNERSERWEFVYPEEVARVVDSVTLAAEVAVTESIAPPVDVDSVTLA